MLNHRALQGILEELRRRYEVACLHAMDAYTACRARRVDFPAHPTVSLVIRDAQDRWQRLEAERLSLLSLIDELSEGHAIGPYISEGRRRALPLSRADARRASG